MVPQTTKESDTAASETLLIAPIATTATLVFILTITKVTLWKARSYAKDLQEKALRVWKDGSPMLDLSNVELHESIIQTALSRGSISVGEHPTKINDTRYALSNFSSEPTSNLCYQRSSSEISNDKDEDMVDETSKVKYNAQVGGLSSSKLPVLTLEHHFVLKPVRIESLEKFDARGEVSQFNTKSWAKDGIHDQTKRYRGVREIAFYESLLTASLLPPLEYLVSELALLIDDSADTSWRSLLALLSLLSLHSTSDNPTLSSSKLLYDTKSSSELSTMLCLMAAYQTGDVSTVSSLKSCAKSWYHFLKEQLDLKCLGEFTAPYAGLLDVSKADGQLSTSTSECSNQHDTSYAQQSMPTSLSQPYLILRDISSSFTHPNIIDIKMGTQTYEPSAPLSKQHREARKYPLQSEFGFRIVGMRVYESASGTFRYWDKSFGTKLMCREDCKNALKLFFQCKGIAPLRKYVHRVLSSVISQLVRIKSWFQVQNTTMGFYASSILIAYEGCETSQCKSESVSDPVVKMIDFAHACRRIGGDFGYIHGIKNLLSILQEILHELNIQ